MTDTANEPADLAARPLRDRAVRAAKGLEPFDLLIRGGTLVDAVTGELREADIGVCGAMIASVHDTGTRDDAARIIDAAGLFVSPSLIDTHMHVESSMVTPAGYAEAVLPRGVTTIVWDPHELANVHGLAGVDWAVEASLPLPLRILLLAPSCVPSAPGLERSGADFARAELQDLLDRKAIAGVAEVMNMQGVIDRATRITDVVQAGLESGKLVCGHARGLEGSDLNAFMAAGITSDHELTSGADLMRKLRAGLTIELRGSHDHLLPEFVEALNVLAALPSTLTLCTDDVFPDDLHATGGLNDVVARLVRYGLSPVKAIQAATLNAAHRLGRADLGLIAPGRRADIALFEDLESFVAVKVIANGIAVAENGILTAPLADTDPALLRDSVHCTQVTAEDFKVRSSGRSVEVATIDRPRFTRWGTAITEVENGCVVPPQGATLMSVIHRHGRGDAGPTTGYLTSWGTWRGAFCTTVSHDSHNVTVFGGNEEDMAVAANWVISRQGGMAVAKDGKILAGLALPLSGLITDAPLSETARDFAAIRKAMEEIVTWKPPYLVFKACFGATLACNAGPHLTDLGLADATLAEPMKNPILKIVG